MRNLIACITAAALLAAPSPPARGAQPPRGDRLVQVPVTVLRRDGAPAPRLTAGDFGVAEDGAPRKISSLSKDAAPVDAALLLDTSASTPETVRIIRAAAAEFAEALRPEDSLSVLGVSAGARVSAPWSQDRAEVREWLDELEPAGETWLYQTAWAALRAAFAARPREHRRVLVVLTDGVDSRATLAGPQGVVREALAKDVTIYVVALNRLAARAVDEMFARGEVRDGFERDYRELQSHFRSAEAPLGELAARTGGRLVFPRDSADLAAVFVRIAVELRSRYVIAFASPADAPSGFHAISVTVRNPALRAYARDGYVKK